MFQRNVDVSSLKTVRKSAETCRRYAKDCPHKLHNSAFDGITRVYLRHHNARNKERKNVCKLFDLYVYFIPTLFKRFLAIFTGSFSVLQVKRFPA